MATEVIAPTAFVGTPVNLTGAVTAVDDDPDAPGGDWLTATVGGDPIDLTVSFPAATGSLTGTQNFKTWLRKTAGTPNPTVAVQLWEFESSAWQFVETVTASLEITSTSGQLDTHSWEASALTSPTNLVACRIVSTELLISGLVSSGLIAEWRFDDGSGQQLTDYGPSGHHGQLGTTAGADADDPTWQAYGLDYDGGDKVNVAAPPKLLTARTFMLAVRIDTLLSTNRSLAGTRPTGTNVGWTMRANSTNALLVANLGGGTVTSSTNLWVAGSDHLISHRFDAANGLELFLDNTSIGSDATGTAATDSGSNPLTLGGPQAGSTSPLIGRLYYAVMYDRRLSDAEMTQNYDHIKSVLSGRGIALP